jgi:hypothetical protein
MEMCPVGAALIHTEGPTRQRQQEMIMSRQTCLKRLHMRPYAQRKYQRI